MLESVVSARGKVLRTNFSATSRVTRATKLTQGQRFRAVEIKDLARAGLRVAGIGEARHDARALVDEGKRLLVVEPFQLCGRVASRLIFNRRDLLAPVLGFCLDDADRVLVDEQNVVGGTDIRLVFADGDAEASAEVYLVFRLHLPASLVQQLVDGVARLLFGGAVLVSHCFGHSYRAIG